MEYKPADCDVNDFTQVTAAVSPSPSPSPGPIAASIAPTSTPQTLAPISYPDPILQTAEYPESIAEIPAETTSKEQGPASSVTSISEGIPAGTEVYQNRKSQANLSPAVLEEQRIATEQASAFRILMQQKKTENTIAAASYRSGADPNMGSSNSLIKTGVGDSGDLYNYSRGAISGRRSSGAINAGASAEYARKNSEQRSRAEAAAREAAAARDAALARERIAGSQSTEHDPYEYDVRGFRKPGRKIASLEKNSSAEGSDTRATEDPWLSYMSETASAALVAQIRNDPSLRERLLERLEEMKNNADQAEAAAILGEILEEAAAEENQELADLKPMTANEAFSMDSDETEKEIRRFLSQLDDPAEAQFRSSETLFKRVNYAHRRSVSRGILKLTQ